MLSSQIYGEKKHKIKEVRYEIVPHEVVISGLEHTRNDRHTAQSG